MGAPCIKAESCLQWPGIWFHPWPFAAHHPISLSPFTIYVSLALIKAKEKNNNKKSLHPSWVCYLTLFLFLFLYIHIRPVVDTPFRSMSVHYFESVVWTLKESIILNFILKSYLSKYFGYHLADVLSPLWDVWVKVIQVCAETQRDDLEVIWEWTEQVSS